MMLFLFQKKKKMKNKIKENFLMSFPISSELNANTLIRHLKPHHWGLLLTYLASSFYNSFTSKAPIFCLRSSGIL